MARTKKRRSSPPRARLQLEHLESRLNPSYVLSGSAWPSPQLVTISFVPDGTIVGVSPTGPVYSNMFSVMNRLFGSPSVWEAAILKGAQTWAAQTNVNFSVVSDNGTPDGQGSYQQGDPGMGDIRIGGYYLTNGWLAQSVVPPPANNFSIAGDIQFNTGVGWKIGNGHGIYDLQTVATHEFGHALGLWNTFDTPADVMYLSYTGVKQSLAPDDIAGVQAIYSNGNPRAQDIYNSDGASNGTEGAAADLTSLLDPTALTALVQNLDIDAPTQAEYFTVTAPTGSSGNLAVTVQSTGLSLLTPSVTVYAADGVTVLGSATSAGNQDGATLTINLSGVTDGTQYYIKVTGADSTAMSTGTYAMTLNFGTGASPTVPLPDTMLLNGNPLHGGGGQAELPPPGVVLMPPGGPGTTPFGGLSTLINAALPGAATAGFVAQASSKGGDHGGSPIPSAFGPNHDETTGHTQSSAALTTGAAPAAQSDMWAQLTAAYFSTAAGKPFGS